MGDYYQLPHLPWQALLKALGLGYLLGLLGIALASSLLGLLRPRLAPTQRAIATRWLLLGSALLQFLLAALIWQGVVTHKIQMTTMHFHHLMHGEWSIAISIAGLSVLAASLLIATWSYRRAGPVRASGERLGSAGPLPLLAGRQVATAALVGLRSPALVVNPQWWGALSQPQRELAMAHELTHWQNRDNLWKLLLEWLAVLYAVVPAARRWLRDFELDCELAADARCAQQAGAPAYRELLASALGFASAQRAAASGAGSKAHIGSMLGTQGLAERLRLLDSPTRQHSGLLLGAMVGGGWLLALLPGLLLLSHPLPRCFLACYLGY